MSFLVTTLALVALVPAQDEGQPSAIVMAAYGDLSSEIPEDLAVMLEDARLARLNGEVETARFILEAVFEEGTYELLLAEEDVVALAGLEALEEMADTLSVLRLLERVREEKCARLAAHLDSDDRYLLYAQEYLAETRLRLGDLEGALALQEPAHATWERLHPAGHPELMRAQGNLAVMRFELGDLEGALALQQEVFEAFERQLPADHLDVVRAKGGVALVRQELGDRQGALVLQEEVHGAMERSLPAGHPELMAAKQSLAITLTYLGEFGRALALMEEVVAVLERRLPVDHPRLLLAKGNLANTRRQLGDREGALALEEEVHAARAGVFPPDHSLLLVAKRNLTATRAQLGDLEGALVIGRSLIAAELALVERLQAEAPRVARESALRELHRRVPSLLLLARRVLEADLESLDPLLFQVVENLRIVSTASIELSRLAGDEDGGELRGRVAASRRRLSDHTLVVPDTERELRDWRDELLRLSAARDRAEEELRAALVGRLGATSVTLADVAAGLAPGSALVSYLRYARYLEDFDSDQVDSLLAFVVTPDATVHRVELGTIAEIEELSTRWRALLGAPLVPGRVEEVGADEEEKVGTELRARVLDPCLGVLEDRPSSVHLVLDDVLHLVPFESLPSEGGRLGRSLALRFETSTRRIVMGSSSDASTGTLVALGGIDFDVETAGPALAAVKVATLRGVGSDGSTSGLARLPETLVEAREIGALFERHFEREPAILSGGEASKQGLHHLAPSARYLHIATHGWFATETLESLIDRLEGQGSPGTLTGAGDTVRGFAPETLCGLALAGANHGASGIMTAEELATLDLSNCELAVLSACETNVGIRRAGQGIQSLQSALQAAGARTAITSLWKVDDAATRRLMELFYTKLWKDGLVKADALWQAKMALRDEGHPIRDWGGWVLTGDPD